MSSEITAPAQEISRPAIAMGVGALLAFISIFVNWFSVSTEETSEFWAGVGVRGIGTFGGVVVLLGCILLGVGLARGASTALANVLSERRAALLTYLGSGFCALGWIIAIAKVGGPSAMGYELPVSYGTGVWVLLVGVIAIGTGLTLARRASN